MSATAADVLRMIEDGGKSQAIADLTGYPRGEVMKIARENGYGLNVSSDRFQPTTQPKPKPQGVILAETTPPPPVLVDVRPAQRDLIAEGKASTVARVRNAAARAELTLQTLADLLDEHRATEAARREVARLEEQLRAAKAALKKPGATDPTLEPKVVRAWAAKHGVDCPATGRVPRVVVDAYLDAVAS